MTSKPFTLGGLCGRCRSSRSELGSTHSTNGRDADTRALPAFGEFLDARLRPIVFEDAPATSSGGYEVTDRALALARHAKWLIVTMETIFTMRASSTR